MLTNMKLVFCLMSVIVLVAAASFYYKTENDYVDIDAVINDLPTLQSYVDCFLERAPCTSLTESFRRIIPDSVIRACDRCNVPQKERYAKFLKGLQTKLPHEYIAFRKKYDPRGIYFDALEAELAKYLDYSVPFLFPYYYI